MTKNSLDVVKLTVGELLAVDQALGALMQIDMPAAAAFRLAVFINRLKPELEAANNQRIEIFKKHGKQAGDRIVVPPEHQAALEREMTPLLKATSEIQFEPLPRTLFDTVANLKPMNLAVLMPFFEK